MTYVVTYIDIQPSFMAQAIAELKRYSDASSAEQGNASIRLLQETSRQNRFVVVEVWTDESSFQRHETATHTAQFRSTLSSIHNSPFDQRVHHAFAVVEASREPERGASFVVTHVDVPPPRREETELLLQRLAADSRTDSGNIRYDVFQQNAPRTNHFTVFAIWNNQSTYASHELQPHTRQFREALGPMLGAPYDERLFSGL